MPALAPVPPETLKRILEKYGYHLLKDDEYNWVLVHDEKDLPIVIPKLGDLVAVDVMMGALNMAKMDNATYFSLHTHVFAEQKAQAN